MRSVQNLVHYAALPFALAYWMIMLISMMSGIRRAKYVILPELAKNFGYTIVIPDTVRRLWPGQALYILTWEPGGTQNPLVEGMWPDVDVRAIRRPSTIFGVAGRRVRLPRHDMTEPRVFALTRWFVRLINPQAKFLAHEDIYPLADQKLPEALSGPLKSDLTGPESAFYHNAVWGHLVKTLSAPPIRFEERKRAQFHKAIETATGHSQRPLCAVHIRRDSQESVHARDGSSIDAWQEAIRAIVDAGYTVLISGDEGPSTKIPFVLDETDLGIDRKLFRLLTVSEASLFIGDSGAGGIISASNRIPVLLFNTYPLTSALPGSWNVPKHLTLKSAPSTPMAEVLQAFPYAPFIEGEHEIDAGTVGADMIYRTVLWFLSSVATTRTEALPITDTEAALFDVLPDHALAHFGEARLAPTFVEWFDERSKTSPDLRRGGIATG